jgi:hypothetical protein
VIDLGAKWFDKPKHNTVEEAQAWLAVTRDAFEDDWRIHRECRSGKSTWLRRSWCRLTGHYWKEHQDTIAPWQSYSLRCCACCGAVAWTRIGMPLGMQPTSDDLELLKQDMDRVGGRWLSVKSGEIELRNRKAVKAELAAKPSAFPEHGLADFEHGSVA